jgi:hypothetical protein
VFFEKREFLGFGDHYSAELIGNRKLTFCYVYIVTESAGGSVAFTIIPLSTIKTTIIFYLMPIPASSGL